MSALSSRFSGDQMVALSVGRTLGEIVEGVDHPGLRLPDDAHESVLVSRVLIGDADRPVGAPEGLVLLPGPLTGETLERWQAMHVAGHVAALVTRDQDGAAAVPALSLADDVSWTEAYELIASVLAVSGHVAGARPSKPSLSRMFALADAAASLLGAAVEIEDQQARVLAYSNIDGQPVDAVRAETILSRAAPKTPLNRAQYLELTRQSGPMRFPPDGSGCLSRLAVAVRAGAEVLGFVWVIDDGTLTDEAEDLLLDVARSAALQILRTRAAQDGSERVEVVRGLLRGEVIDARAGLRLRSERPQVLAVTDRSAESSGWLGPYVALACRARVRAADCLEDDGVVYAVIVDERDTCAQLAESIVSDLRDRHDVDACAVLGPPTSWTDLADSRRAADLGLRVLLARADMHAATHEQLRSAIGLARIADLVGEDALVLANAPEPVVRGEEDTTLASLDAWLQSMGDVGAVARRFGVHPNTVRYRLRRAAERYDIDLTDPESRLHLAIQLHFARLRAASAPR